jgi:hypothetical protein
VILLFCWQIFPKILRWMKQAISTPLNEFYLCTAVCDCLNVIASRKSADLLPARVLLLDRSFGCDSFFFRNSKKSVNEWETWTWINSVKTEQLKFKSCLCNNIHFLSKDMYICKQRKKERKNCDPTKLFQKSMRLFSQTDHAKCRENLPSKKSSSSRWFRNQGQRVSPQTKSSDFSTSSFTFSS